MIGYLVHGTNWYAMDRILVDHLQPGGGSVTSAAQQPGGGDMTPAVRVDNHFAAFAPWDKECMAGMRKESEVHVFYDIVRVTNEGALIMVSANCAILSRDRITPDAIVMVTANARGNYKIVWHIFLEGRDALPDPAYCFVNGIDIENQGASDHKG